MQSATATLSSSPNSVDSDDAVVAVAVADLRKFEPLYDRYAASVYLYCLRRLGDREQAEDVTSIVFTRAMQSLDQYQPQQGSFRAWLFTIAHHAVTDVFRAAQRKPVEWLDERAPDRAPSPEEIALMTDRREQLYALLAMLSPEHRQVVELRLAGLSGIEIASVLGKSHAAIRQLQSRAMHSLQILAARQTQHEQDAHS